MSAQNATTAASESAVVFDGTQGPLVGVISAPAEAARALVLIVAGQPQTRVGSHRMFVELARGLAARGVAVLRFDAGGWGDSPGEARPFEESARDVAAAARALVATRGGGEAAGSADRPPDSAPHSAADSAGQSAAADTPPLWIWGLCDGASAAVLALPALREAEVEPQALCLVNPWVRSEASHADAMVRTYYGRRIFSGEFWGRLLTGKVPLRHLLEPLRHLARRGAGSAEPDTRAAAPSADLPGQLLAELSRYRGRVVTVLSGNDLTAGETESLLRSGRRWRRRIERDGEVIRVPGADHTFSDPAQWHALIERIAKLAAPQD